MFEWCIRRMWTRSYRVKRDKTVLSWIRTQNWTWRECAQVLNYQQCLHGFMSRGERAISFHSRLVRATCINCILMIFFGILFYIKMFLKSLKTNIVCERYHDLRLTFITADKCHRWHVIISPLVPPLVKIESLSSVEDKSFGFLISILHLFSFDVGRGVHFKTFMNHPSLFELY